MEKTDNYDTSINEITQTLTYITTSLNDIDLILDEDTFFTKSIKLYGLINYSRNQFLPKTSSFITDNHAFNDIFFNYTSVESMILDLFLIIESDLIRALDKNDSKVIDKKKFMDIINFSNGLLELLNEIINTRINLNNKVINEDEYDKLNREYTGKLFNMQNDFYNMVYDEKVDFRIK